jgi:hypothetical protein
MSFQVDFDEEEEVLYCAWHPKVETGLRCYECDTPICPKCATRTPVGYLCVNCRKGRQKRFEQSKPLDYVIAGLVSAVLGALTTFLVGFVVMFVGWLTIFLSPLAGTVTAEVVWRSVRRRYGSRLWWIVAVGFVLGSLPLLLPSLLMGIGAAFSANPFGTMQSLWMVLHVVMAVGSAVARLRLH